MKVIRVFHYTEDSEWNLKKIEIKNGNIRIKPYGGIWASPVDSKYGWDRWCKEEDFRDIDKLVKVEMEIEILEDKNLIIIDSKKDLNKLIWTPLPIVKDLAEKLGLVPPFGMEIIDFVAMKDKGIDAIWLTEKGQWDTRLCYPRNLYGWDCECILILSERCIRSWRII